MSHYTDRSFVGEGTIYGRPYQSQDAFLEFGNCDAASIKFATERKTLSNYRGGGGNLNVRERVTDVTGTISLYDLTPDNLARVTRATVMDTAAGAVADEPHACRGVKGELVPFKYLPDLGQPVTVKSAGGADWVAGADYLLTAHGIVLLAERTVGKGGLTISYTRQATSAVQLLNGSPVQLELFIAGLNDAQSGEPFSLAIRRARFGMLQELPVFGQDYVKLEGPFDLLADTQVTEPGISRFATWTQLNKAA